nr:sigma-54 dependent transcriptional regulator [Planctomycetota bacterium]
MDRLSHSTILVVDDDPRLLKLMCRWLKGLGCESVGCETAQEGLARAAGRPLHAAILDLMLPDMSGIKLMERLLEMDPDLPCLLITGKGDVPTAVQAMKSGAFSFLVKPVKMEEVEASLRCAVEAQSLKIENSELRQQVREATSKRLLLGDSAQVTQLRRVIDQVSRSDATVLITGDSGTGKELVAREIHERGPRADRALVSLNCSAVPASLLESELFGSVAGAYTGATSSRRGRFVLADGGTLFLDEVGDMSLEMQAKVLRVLQEQEFEPVGSDTTVRVDARVIAATNRDLPEMIRGGKFREDLYYRLNVVPIEVPPLREHIEDLPLLVAHFLQRSNGGSNGHTREFTSAALAQLANHTWPGNVRELENLVERVRILSDSSRLDVSDLEGVRFVPRSSSTADAEPHLPAQGLDLSLALEGLERSLIDQALERTSGNKSNAAKLLGLKRTTFVEKLRRLGEQELDA